MKRIAAIMFAILMVAGLALTVVTRTSMSNYSDIKHDDELEEGFITFN